MAVALSMIFVDGKGKDRLRWEGLNGLDEMKSLPLEYILLVQGIPWFLYCKFFSACGTMKL